MALTPTPQRKQIFQFPTPNLEDRVFYELHDATQMNYKVPEYGTPHPNQSKYAGYVFALVKSANDSGWVTWFYLNERANQDEYNYEITYPYADTSFPAYVRTYVLKREDLVEPAAGTPDPVHGLGLILTAHKQTRLSDPVLDSLFVGVQRAYEKLPGPVIQSFTINNRGDTETQFEQVVPSGATLQADGITVTKSVLEYESTVKGKKVYSTVTGHSVLVGGLIVDSMEGLAGQVTSTIVSPNTPLPVLGSSTSSGIVISATRTPISATKSELKVVTVPSLPSVKKQYYNERGELETETTNYVLATGASAKPDTDSLTTVKSTYVQDSVGFGRVVTSKVPAYIPNTAKSYSSNYKGALVYEYDNIVNPDTPVVAPGSSPGVSALPSTSKVVTSSVAKRTPTKAVQKIVAIDRWPTLYDYFFEDELNSWVSVKYEIIPFSQAQSEVGATGYTVAPFIEIEYKSIDAFWTAKTTKTVLSRQNLSGAGPSAFRIDKREVEYDFPSIFLGVRYFVLVNTKGRDYPSVQPLVLSGFRKYVQAEVHVIYCGTSNILTTDANNKPFKATQIVPVNVSYNGVLMKFDAGRCLSAGNGYVQAFSGTGSQRWNPPILETYSFPQSYPPEMPETVNLPARVTPWKYNLFKHELFKLNTKLPQIVVDTGTGAISVLEP